jgi:YD repeat-containing protein
MMIETRVKVAFGILIGVASVIGSAHATAAPVGTETHYQCDARQRLVVWRTADSATVQFIDRTYELRRRDSGIGIKYIAPKAALIIDGNSAVFVAQDRLQLGQCLEASQMEIGG